MKNTTEEFNKIVQQAIQGNKHALEELCHQKGQGILYLCLKMMKNQHDGEDAAQEVFVNLQRNITKLKSPEAFNVWLRTMVLNTCNNMRRKNMNSNGNLPLDDYSDFLPEEDLQNMPEEYMDTHENRQELIAVIDTLPQTQRACVLLFYYDGMSYEEIAQALGTSSKAVSVHLSRARTKIKTELQQNLPKNQLRPLLPMAVISNALRQEAAEKAPPALVRSCIAAANASNSGGALSLLKFLTNAVIVVGGATIIGAAALSILSPASSSAASQLWVNVPQQIPAASIAAEFEDTAASLLVAPQPASLPPAQPALSVPVGMAPGANSQPQKPAEVPQSSPAYIPPPPAAPALLTTPVQGSLALQTISGQPVPASGHYAVGFYVSVLKNGTVIAQTTANQQGEFSFLNLQILEGTTDAYQIQVEPTSNRGVTVIPGLPNGLLEVTLTPGTATTLPTIYLADTEAPSASIALFGADDQHTVVNPQRAAFVINDATNTTCNWQITSKATGQIIAAGSDNQLQSQLQIADKGEYVLQVTATDIAGNQTTAELIFYIV
ncbi:sigma-70 family RNA polymerase sigma factor [Ruminococcaceae bacterium OttesenSCG-928-A16]|nr:sigma-70 family RNA polymerase sigma factor [Ruminococcaceae bacterium OttesenSCG-928-A16]